VLVEVSFADFATEASGDVEVVQYAEDVLAQPSNSAAEQELRARSLLGCRGLLVAEDASGNAVAGYCPVSLATALRLLWLSRSRRCPTTASTTLATS